MDSNGEGAKPTELMIDHIDILRATLPKWTRQEFPFEDNLRKWEQSQVTESLGFIEECLKDPLRKEHFQKILTANPDIGIMFNEDDWTIFPIAISEWLKKRNWKPILVHQGFVKGTSEEPFDNMKQLEETGFWGAPNKPTYLAPIDSLSVAPNFVFPEDAKQRQPTVAYVDPDKLAKARQLWIGNSSELRNRFAK